MSIPKLPPNIEDYKYISHGLSSLVFLHKSKTIVLKTPRDESEREAINQERKIYERFNDAGGHIGLLRYYGSISFDGELAHAIYLEYAPRGQLSDYLKKTWFIFNGQRLKWIKEIAEALEFVHSAGITHGDISCHNIFLDEEKSAKLCDFAGSSIDGSEYMVAYSASHQSPYQDTGEKADIFALGSVFYQIMTRARPYAKLTDSDIKSRYEARDFPELASIKVMGPIINKCWQNKYDRMGSLIADLDAKSSTKIPCGR